MLRNLIRSKYFSYALFLLVAALTVTTLCVAVWMNFGNRAPSGAITLSPDEEPSRELSVTLSDFVPGRTQSTDITLAAANGESFVITLAFTREEESPLADFLTVTISVGDKTIETATLAAYLDGKTIAFDYVATKDETLTISYTMPETVGDEAQGATADFRLDITIARENATAA